MAIKEKQGSIPATVTLSRMPYLSKPTLDGTYRIKVQGQNLYIESDPGTNAGLRLTPLDSSNSKQKWSIVRQPNGNYKINSTFDNAGLSYYRTSNTYWGYGYPLPQTGTSVDWVIQESGSHSKIRSSDSSYHMDCCDPGSNAVHFYYDKPDHGNQKFEFELLTGSNLGGNNSSSNTADNGGDTTGNISNGLYRIKVQGRDQYIESDPGTNGGLRLTPLDSSNSKQKWSLSLEEGNDYTITSAYDKAGLTYSTSGYWGYGYPLPGDPNSDSVIWTITSYAGYYKINRKGYYRPIDSCDPGSDAIHFYSEKSDHIEQRYVFELVQSN